MQRVYYPYWEWEDYINGMWIKLKPNDEINAIKRAVKFTGNSDIYGSYMLKVHLFYPKATEHNLTCTGMNRQAWIGHAAVNIAINIPEYITRIAWWQLTDEQRINANLKADYAIEQWEREYNAISNKMDSRVRRFTSNILR